MEEFLQIMIQNSPVISCWIGMLERRKLTKLDIIYLTGMTYRTAYYEIICDNVFRYI